MTRLSALFSGSALVLLAMALVMGLIGSLFYTPYFSSMMNLGFSFQSLRPLHTSTAVSWIYLAGVAMVLHYLLERGLKEGGESLWKLIRRNSQIQYVLWLIAGVCTVGALIGGLYTGREYIVFPPLVAGLILVGWLLYAHSFYKVVGFRWTKEPVYVWMWGMSICLFTYCFLEAHAYLLPFLQEFPVRDMAIQWKSYGALVGSFNLLVYGCLIYLSEQMYGCKKYARSNQAFSLFFVGLLNSFTNFGHHTYHLPQSSWVKWIAFSVSMLEIIIFMKVLWDLFGMRKCWNMRARFPIVVPLVCATSMWTMIQLFLSILISVPPLNSMVHGTLLILAHSMGSVIGIDTMALLAVTAFLVQKINPNTGKPWVGFTLVGIMNFGLMLLFVGLLYGGIWSSQYLMANQQPVPTSLLIPTGVGFSMFIGGVLMAGAIWVMTLPWLRSFVQEFQRRPVPPS